MGVATIEVTEEIKKAIERAEERSGSLSMLGKECGLSGSLLGKYKSGKTPHMTQANWSKLYPHIRRHLPPEPTAKGYPMGTRSLPVYGTANALALDKGYILGDLVPDSDDALETIVPVDQLAVAAFKVDGQSMEGERIFDGSIVVCRKVDSLDDLPNGCIVVAKHDGVLLVKKYRRISPDRMILSGSGQAAKDWDLSPKDIDWILRVSEVVWKF